jgi:hypothetical protein
LEINDGNEYLWNAMDVTWDVSGFTGNKNSYYVYQQSSSGSKSFVGGIWEGNTIRFKTRNFGTFVLAQDNVKPSISPVKVSGSELRFTIRDNSSGIQSFEATVNGKWVLMRYEHKQAIIWSEKLDEQPFKGSVNIKVTDRAGNITEWNGTL